MNKKPNGYFIYATEGEVDDGKKANDRWKEKKGDDQCWQPLIDDGQIHGRLKTTADSTAAAAASTCMSTRL